jgi:hypothetical protein
VSVRYLDKFVLTYRGVQLYKVPVKFFVPIPELAPNHLLSPPPPSYLLTMPFTQKQYLDPSTALEHLKTYAHSDGLSVTELIDSRKNGGLTYNDFLMLPGKIDFGAAEVVTETKVTRNVVLKTPFMSSPMDTVTEGEMAIAIAVSNPHAFFC